MGYVRFSTDQQALEVKLGRRNGCASGLCVSQDID